MIVYGVGKMVSGDAVGFEQDEILIVFRHLDGAFNQVVKPDPPLRIPRSPQTQHIRFACLDSPGYLFRGQITAGGEGAVVAGAQLIRLLPLPDLGEPVGRTEAGIGEPFQHQFFRIGVVDRGAFALTIGAVIPPDFPRCDESLIDRQAKIGETAEDILRAACDLPLLSVSSSRK